MSVSVALALDADGFLPRACPHCRQEFRWHHGPVGGGAEQPPPAVYFCPLCGRSAAPDQWFTDDQAEQIRRGVRPAVARAAASALRRAGRGTRTRLRITFTEGPAITSAPGDDLIVVASPCHPHEPVKVPRSRIRALHCLVCGAALAGHTPSG